MSKYAELLFSRSRVDRAGKSIREGTFSSEDAIVVENWRTAHGYILNTFQANLRNRARSRNIIIGQRLKRRPTIFDKLRREPNMQLTTMHDIAGCRLIFAGQQELTEFRNNFHTTRALHERQVNEDQYNYILTPKDSGYRGIHDVYKYKSLNILGRNWNKLKIEIQYRTVVQHAWATAVETADLLTSARIKFSDADDDYKEFFRICSELFARTFEGKNSVYPSENSKILASKLQEIDGRIQLRQTLRNASYFGSFVKFKQNSILIFYLDDLKLTVNSYDSLREATVEYSRYENELQGKADIVLVRGDNYDSIRNAFRNYFSDAKEFLRYVDIAIDM
jgi:putative GTP pyrophosphokinase